ncbi:MAG: gamma-glutamyltransferase [Rhizobiaceae bacterium]
MRNLQLPGRSTIHSTNGMAATSHPLATLTAVNILQAGGNAIDAAIAACAVQCVVEPGSTGIGGDCFVLYAPKGSGDIIALNGSGRAPAAANPEWYAQQNITKIEQQSAHAVTIPGAIDAWSRLIKDHGTMSFGEILQPAIKFARDGFPLSQRVAEDWKSCVKILSGDPTTSEIYLKDGKAMAYGSVHRQPDHARTLENIAEHGRSAFYEGQNAEAIVSYLNGLGGLHTMEDFAATSADYVTPIKTSFVDHEVYECPPNGQGIVALEILNILAGMDVGSLDPLSSERLHLEIEASRLAYADRDAALADPSKIDIPIDYWLSEEHAASLRGKIDRTKAMPVQPLSNLVRHDDTVYITVVDKDRNAVSFINSLFSGFGTGLMAPGTGVLLQNRGMGFQTDPNHPNCIAPNKRPLHTIIPGMLVKDDQAVMPFGVMGGHYQATGHVHLLHNLYIYGMDLQEAIEFPRVFPNPGGGIVDVEDGVPDAVKQELIDLGHKITRPIKAHGGAQAIQIDWQNSTLRGASESRKDGCAIGY